MSDVAQLLRDLLASGQFGIIVIVLIIVIGGAAWAIYLQRQTMSRFETIIKAVELNMKSAQQAREETKAAQNEATERWQKQYDWALKTNQELRDELERIRSDQAIFEDNVKEAIHLGFKELKSYLNQSTVQEIIGQIPESFKKDLANRVEEMYRQVYERLREVEYRLYQEGENTIRRFYHIREDEIVERIIMGVISSVDDRRHPAGIWFNDVFPDLLTRRMLDELERRGRLGGIGEGR